MHVNDVWEARPTPCSSSGHEDTASDENIFRKAAAAIEIRNIHTRAKLNIPEGDVHDHHAWKDVPR